jgi:putative aminopeptidase FrvX
MREILKRLVETPGGSGFEERVIELITTEMKKHIADVTVDPMGNVVGKIPSSGKRSAMVCVHSDEVGMLVKCIDPKGYIYFDLNGMLDQRVLFSTRVS